MAQFLPPLSAGPSSVPAVRDAQLAYAKANARLIKVSPVFQHYVLGESLGRGSFATVRVATRRAPAHVYIPERVAIKVIDKARTDDLAALKREVAFMTTLSHPNIIQLFQIFDAKARLYIVMELAEGGDLFDRIVARGSYTEADAKRAVRQLCSALAHVHQQSIVHRDLKPENLLCASTAADAPIKVTDFGLAAHHRIEGGAGEGGGGGGGDSGSEPSSPKRRISREKGVPAASSQSPNRSGGGHHTPRSARPPAAPRDLLHDVLRAPVLRLLSSPLKGSTPAKRTTPASPKRTTPSGTRHAGARALNGNGSGSASPLPTLTNSSTRTVGRNRSLVGTPLYMSPEVLSSAIFSPACDMWAVGVILYFSLLGRPPFLDSNPERLGELIRTCRYDNCEGEGWERVSDDAKDLVRRLLVADHRARLTATAVLSHPWVAQAAVIEGMAPPTSELASLPEGSFKLQAEGLAKLAEHRDLSASIDVTQMVPDVQTVKEELVQSFSFKRQVSFANETWGPQTVLQSQA